MVATGPTPVAAAADTEWHGRVTLEIAPNPRLAPHQRAAIAADYRMTTGQRLLLTPRRAVAWYVKRRLGLVAGHRSRSPADQHIVLVSETPAPPGDTADRRGRLMTLDKIT